MSKAYDVAAYIVKQCPLMTTMKLQKIVYYSYAEYAKETGEPLFNELFEAWRNGPVLPSLYMRHRGYYIAEREIFTRAGELTDGEKTIVQRAIDKYAHMSGQELSAKTHSESPWLDARAGKKSYEPSKEQIPFESVHRWAKQYA